MPRRRRRHKDWEEAWAEGECEFLEELGAIDDYEACVEGARRYIKERSRRRYYDDLEIEI